LNIFGSVRIGGLPPKQEHGMYAAKQQQQQKRRRHHSAVDVGPASASTAK
jgi:hypothetical protein